MFPTDTLSKYVDDHNNTTGILLPAVSHDRTILYTTMSCKLGTDNSIQAGSNMFVDTETNNNVYKFVYEHVASGTSVTYTKQTANDVCFMGILYVDRNISLTTVSSSTPTYISTSTDVNILNGTELLFLLGLLIFFISFNFWGRLFRPINKII